MKRHVGIRRPAGVSDCKLVPVLLFVCTCSFVLFLRVFASLCNIDLAKTTWNRSKNKSNNNDDDDDDDHDDHDDHDHKNKNKNKN